MTSSNCDNKLLLGIQQNNNEVIDSTPSAMDDNNFTKPAFAVINAITLAVITGYLATEYLLPYVKRKFFLSSSLKTKLQLEENIQLNKYEAEIAENAIHPSEITTRFQDIGGHVEVINTLKKNLSAILHQPTGKLLKAPMGILLYGPPGCGKTLLAKAIAKDANLRFLVLPLSLVLDKWVGETEKYLEALFTLARKIRPCVIFIDEIDSLTRRRNPLDRDWNLTMKSHFLSLWDGIVSSELNSQILILGATNRKSDIDDAFLRRMPLQIRVSLPTATERIEIIKKLLIDSKLNQSFNFEEIASQTENWSGSDLKELCRRVALDSYFENKEETDTESLDNEMFIDKIGEMLLEFEDSQNVNE